MKDQIVLSAGSKTVGALRARFTAFVTNTYRSRAYLEPFKYFGAAGTVDRHVG